MYLIVVLCLFFTSFAFSLVINKGLFCLVQASLHHDVRYGSFGLQQDYKSSGYEYSTTTEKHTKYKTQIIFITVISCLIVLGAGGAFFISLVKWNHYHDDTPQNHFEMVQAKGQMRIQQDFTEELNNKTSLVYLNFTHDFCEEITTSIKWDSLTILRNCAVTGLRNGSIVVEFTIFLQTEISRMSVEILDSTFRKSFMKKENDFEYFGKYPVTSASLSLSILTPYTSTTKDGNTISTFRTLTRAATTLQPSIDPFSKTLFTVLPSSVTSSKTTSSPTTLPYKGFISTITSLMSASTTSTTMMSSIMVSTIPSTISPKTSVTKMSIPAVLSTTAISPPENSTLTLAKTASNFSSKHTTISILMVTHDVSTVPVRDTSTKIPAQATNVSKSTSFLDKISLLSTDIHNPSKPPLQQILNLNSNTSPKYSRTALSGNAISTSISTIRIDTSASASSSTPNKTLRSAETPNTFTYTSTEERTSWKDSSATSTKEAFTRTSTVTTTFPVPPTPPQQEIPQLRTDLTNTATKTLYSSYKTTITTNTNHTINDGLNDN